MMLSHILRLLCYPFSPGRCISPLLDLKSPLLGANAAIGLLGLCYALTLYGGYLNGFGAVVEPILPIAPEKYYLWSAIFILPFLYLYILIFTIFCRWMAGRFGGSGNIKTTYTVFAYSTFLPTLLFLWLPETVLFLIVPERRSLPLGGFQFWPVWVDISRQVLAIILPLIATTYGIRISESLSPIQSALVVFMGYIPAGAFAASMIR